MFSKLDFAISGPATLVLLAVLVARAILFSRRVGSLQDLALLQRDPTEVPVVHLFNIDSTKWTDEGVRKLKLIRREVFVSSMFFVATWFVLDILT